MFVLTTLLLASMLTPNNSLPSTCPPVVALGSNTLNAVSHRRVDKEPRKCVDGS